MYSSKDPTLAELVRALFEPAETRLPDVPDDLAPRGDARLHSLLLARLREAPLSLGDRLLLFTLWPRDLEVQRATDTLTSVIADAAVGPAARATAVLLLAQCNQSALSASVRSLSPSDSAAIVQERFATEFALQYPDPNLGRALSSYLLAAPPDLRTPRLHVLDQMRRRAGLPAAIAYALPIATTELAPQRETLLRLVVDEGGLGSKRTLEMLWARTSDATIRTAVGNALAWFERGDVAPAASRHRAGQAAWRRTANGEQDLLLMFRHPDGFGIGSTVQLTARPLQCSDVFVMPGRSELHVRSGPDDGTNEAAGEITLDDAQARVHAALANAGPSSDKWTWETLLTLCLFDGFPEAATPTTPASTSAMD